MIRGSGNRSCEEIMLEPLNWCEFFPAKCFHLVGTRAGCRDNAAVVAAICC